MQQLADALKHTQHGWKGVIVSSGLYVISKFYALIGMMSLANAAQWGSVMTSILVFAYTAWQWYVAWKDRKKKNIHQKK
jgi:hypothetical protein